MSTPLLTPQGVSQKTTELYALPEAALQAQVALIQLDLLTWMDDNFELTDQQYDYLDALAPDFKAAFTGQIARTVANRWPVIYLPAPLQEITVLDEKWIRSREESVAGNGSSLSAQYTGSLTIETGF